MKIKTIVRFGFAVLAMGTFFGVGLPVRANQLVWVRAQPLNSFKVRGLAPPGSYSHNEIQKSATVAVNKAGQGVGKKQQTTSNLGQKTAHQAANLNKADERWLNIYKSLSFGGA
jgi:hypothetical protein